MLVSSQRYHVDQHTQPFWRTNDVRNLFI